jgi:hypothetical protein
MARHSAPSAGRYGGRNIERLLDDLPPLPVPEPERNKQGRPPQRGPVAGMTDADRSRFYNSPISPDMPPYLREVDA